MVFKPVGVDENGKFPDRVQTKLNDTFVGSNRATDIANSWWSGPRTYYDAIRRRVYFSGCSRGSGTLVGTATMTVGYFDLTTGEVIKHPVRVGVPDDHNTPTMLITQDLPPLIFTTDHDNDSLVKMHRGPAAHDFSSFVTSDVAFPSATSYQHAHRKPGTQTLAVMTRQADGWWMRRSTDWGATWDTAFRLHGKSYCWFKRVGDEVHYVTTIHPTTGINVDVRYFKVNLLTGAITDGAGSNRGDFWTINTVVPAANMTLVKQYTDPSSVRVLDVAPDGSILVCEINKNNPELGGTYRVKPFQTGGTWGNQDVVSSGVPVGYNPSSYVGGAVFGSSSSEIFLTREDGGVWSLERWARSSNTWALDKTIRSVTGGLKLGRPQVPFLGENEDHLMVLEYRQYSSENYWDYYADELLLRK